MEVDLEVSEELHEFLSDFLPASTTKVIAYGQLGQFEHNVFTQLNEKQLGQSKKLLQTLYSKQRYVLHYSTLKFYVRLGLRITKLYRTLKFRQSKWLAPYVRQNSERWRMATNKFEENFYKLM